MIRHGPAANDEITISRTGGFLGVLPIIAIPLDTHDRFAHHHRHHHEVLKESKDKRVRALRGAFKGLLRDILVLSNFRFQLLGVRNRFNFQLISLFDEFGRFGPFKFYQNCTFSHTSLRNCA